MKIIDILEGKIDLFQLKKNSDLNKSFTKYSDLEKRIFNCIFQLKNDVELLSLLFHYIIQIRKPLRVSKKILNTEINIDKGEFPYKFFTIEKISSELSLIDVNQETVETIFSLYNLYETGNSFENYKKFYEDVRLISNKTVPIEKNVSDLTGFNSYKSSGQKLAMTEVISANPGSCSLVNLPTGSGKTVLSWLSHLYKSKPGLSILVIPTIGLEQDQFYRALNFFSNKETETEVRFIYSQNYEKQKNIILEKINNGEDLFLILSPEMLNKIEINKAVLKSASRGNLFNLIVDEAHIIPEWGLDFRPEYLDLITKIELYFNKAVSCQKLPPRVFLFSGTFNQGVVDFLFKSFYFLNEINYFGSVFLRKELNTQIVVDSILNKKIYDKDQSLIDLFFLLPKPLIIYSYEIKKAEQIKKLLEVAGFLSCETFTGNTSAEKREYIIKSFSGKHCEKCTRADEFCFDHIFEQSLNIVVGNKAFGLGIDVENVKTVLHLGLTQNIHEYYQQIGRGGRSGNETLCLLIYSPEDVDFFSQTSGALRLPNTIISRWKLMVKGDLEFQDRIKVDLTTQSKKGLKTEYSVDSLKRNTELNKLTLRALSLANLIKAESENEYKILKKFNENEWIKILENQKKLIDELISSNIKSLVENFSDPLLLKHYYTYIHETTQITPKYDEEIVFNINLKKNTENDSSYLFYYYENLEELPEKILNKFSEKYKSINVYIKNIELHQSKMSFNKANNLIFFFDRKDKLLKNLDTNGINLIIFQNDEILDIEEIKNFKAENKNLVYLINQNSLNSNGETIMKNNLKKF